MPGAPKKPSTDDIVVPPPRAPADASARAPSMRNRLPRREITIALSAKKKGDDQPPESPKTARGASFRRPPSGSSKNALIFGGGALLVALLLIGTAWIFSSVSVVVEPRERSAVYEGSFVAYADASAGDAIESPLIYETREVIRDSVERVAATERKEVSERAVGTIVVYNDFSTDDQRLVTNTRFETPDGKIFRINKPLIVPGQTTQNGEKVPGSIEVAVFADEPGESYNIGLSDFTVPGFKGSPRFDHFFARSKTPMTGGFEGTRLAPPEEALTAARERLRSSLTAILQDAVPSEVPKGMMLLGTGMVSFEELPIKEEEGAVAVTLRGRVPAVLIDASLFAGRVAESALPDYDGFPVSFAEPRRFTLSLSNPATSEEEDEESETSLEGVIQIDVAGDFTFEWYFDPSKLAEDLAGRSSDEMESIMQEKHPGIESANADFRPLCIRCRFPMAPDEIEIQTLESIPEEG